MEITSSFKGHLNFDFEFFFFTDVSTFFNVELNSLFSFCNKLFFLHEMINNEAKKTITMKKMFLHLEVKDLGKHPTLRIMNNYMNYLNMKKKMDM